MKGENVGQRLKEEEEILPSTRTFEESIQSGAGMSNVL